MAPEDTLIWRLQNLEEVAKRLDQEKADQTVVDRLATSVDGLRRILVGFMATVAGSAIVVSFTVLATHLGSSH